MAFASLTRLLLDGAARDPQRPAFVFLGEGPGVGVELTAADLARRAGEVAALLREEGVRPRRNVLVALPSGLGFVSAFFGCALAGNVPVPCSPPGNPRHDTRFPALMAAARAAAVLAEPAAIRRILPPFSPIPGPGGGRPVFTPQEPPASAFRWIGLEEGIPLPPGDRFLACPPNHPEQAFIQFSSGSTAAPRGVVVSQGNLASNLRSAIRTFRFDRRTVFVSWLPMHHDMGLVGMILVPLANRNTAFFLSPPAFARDPLAWPEAVSGRANVTSGGPNFAYELCAARARAAPERVAKLTLDGWSRAFCGAEPVSPASLGRFAEAFAPAWFDRRAFRPCYGLAESTLMVSCATDLRTDPATGVVSCGSPGPGIGLVIADPRTGAALPEGDEGEIRVAGPSVAAGYFRRRAETRRTFRAKTPGRRGGWLRTGDLGFMRDGQLYVTGRIKEMLIVRGVKHHPVDLERTALDALPAGSGPVVAAFPCPQATGEGVAMALELPREQWRDETRRVEAERAVRAAVCREHGVLLDRVSVGPPGFIPRTTSGKIRRFRCAETLLTERLPSGAATRAGDGEGEAIFGSLAERLVCDALLRLTGTAPARADENLLAAGLDSLALVALASELGDYGLDLAAGDLVEDPTVSAMAARLEACLETGRVGAGRPPRPAPAEAAPEADQAAPDFPLSATQAGFLPPRTPENGTVLLAFVALPADTPPENTRAALQYLADRHDALRLRAVPGPGGRWRQRFAPREEGPLVESDPGLPAGPWPDATFKGRLHGLIRSLDPENGPLLRGVHLPANEARGPLLVVAIHHLCLDLTSGAILFREFAEALDRLATGRPLVSAAAAAPGFASYLRSVGEVKTGPRPGPGDEIEDGWAWEPDISPPAAGFSPPGETARFSLSADGTRNLLDGVIHSRGWRPDEALAWCAAWAVARETGNDRVCLWVFRNRRDRSGVVPPTFRGTVGMLAGYEPLWPDVSSPDALDRVLEGRELPLHPFPPTGGGGFPRPGPGERLTWLPVQFNYLGAADVLFPTHRGVRLNRFLVRGEGTFMGWASRWTVSLKKIDGRLALRICAPAGEAERVLALRVGVRLQNLLDSLVFMRDG